MEEEVVVPRGEGMVRCGQVQSGAVNAMQIRV